MKLSEAIRTGGGDLPQWKVDYYRQNSRGKITACCAFGAGAIALQEDAEELFRSFLEPEHERVSPVDGEIASLGILIVRLNDEHNWTRAQIADWVESVGH